VRKIASRTGFSLVEVTLAIGIVGFALLAILGLIPVGLKSGRDSIDATRTSLIAQNAINRMRAALSSNDPTYTQRYFGPDSAGVASFFFYDSQGVATGELLRVQAPNDQPQFYQNVAKPTDFYRVKATVFTFDQGPGYPSYDPRSLPATGSPTLLCGTLEIAWPVTVATGGVPAGRKQDIVAQSFFLRKP